MKTPPLKAVKDKFGDKKKLVDALKGLATDQLWVGKLNEDRGGFNRISNSKLLRLHETLSKVKKDFGSRGKLIDSILELTKRSRDAGYKGSLETYSTPQLVDLQTVAAKKAKVEEKKAKAPKAEKPVAPKKKKLRTKKAKAKAAAGAVSPAAKPAAKKKK